MPFRSYNAYRKAFVFTYKHSLTLLFPMPYHVPTRQMAVETVQLVSSQEKTGFLEMLLCPSDPIISIEKHLYLPTSIH